MVGNVFVADRGDLPLAVLRIDPDSEVIDGFDDMMVRFSPNLRGLVLDKNIVESPVLGQTIEPKT